MGKYKPLFVNTIEDTKKKIDKINEELGCLPKWRCIRREYLRWRRAGLTNKLHEMEILADNNLREVTFVDFKGKSEENRHEHR